MARRKPDPGRARNDCPCCEARGSLCSACGSGACPGQSDGHVWTTCAGCEGVGIPVRVGVWRGTWRPVVVNGEPVPATTKRRARGLTVVVRDADGAEREVAAEPAEATR
jgi:hypothetical protein